MMLERFILFKEQKNPVVLPYLPGSETSSDDDLLDMDLKHCLEQFNDDRVKLVDLLNGYSESDWQNEGHHPEYKVYNPGIFLRHIMMHDHLHMYRIEELGLTTEAYLQKNQLP